MVTQANQNVYMESMEATAYTKEEPNQVRNRAVLGTHIRIQRQRLLGKCEKYNAARGRK